MTILIPILIAIAIAILISLSLGIIIGVAAKVFEVETDPRIEEVTEMLPGANCGGCGFAGCADFAKAVVGGETEPSVCPVCGEPVVADIAKLLGVEVGSGEKQVAIVLCGGNNTVAKQGMKYNGINDCKSAQLVAGGSKACRVGCLGLASCARGCPFNAIEIVDGLAVVHPEVCVGCGKCVETCPRKLIKMIPMSAEVHVFCSSTEKGAPKKKNCSVACIGCRKCVKAADEGQIDMDGFLAVVNYENPPVSGIVSEAACPTNCLQGGEEETAVAAEEAKEVA